jgi:hypothetical protein
MLNIETLWKDYLAYEQGINQIIADKMLMERSKDYMNARRVAKELEIIIRGLSKNYPSVPPTGSPEECKQVRRVADIQLFISIRYVVDNSCMFRRSIYGKNT